MSWEHGLSQAAKLQLLLERGLARLVTPQVASETFKSERDLRDHQIIPLNFTDEELEAQKGLGKTLKDFKQGSHLLNLWVRQSKELEIPQ